MSVQILKSKLVIPPFLPGQVERPRLLHMLDQGLSKKLTLVSAPAGYGKTTLLAEWAENVRTCDPWIDERSNVRTFFSWLSLDESDNDLSRFTAYLAASLQNPSPALDIAGLAPLGYESLFEFQAAFLNQVYALPGDIVLVLDDFHVIHHPPVQELVSFLLDHLPRQMHLVIASRADPPLPLPRLRARNQLVEIRLNELRFSLEEVTTFLRQSSGLDLSAAALSALSERTEGWAAGLQMAAIAMQGYYGHAAGERLEQYVRAFTGSSRYILDYLVEEVLDRQPEAIRNFLLKTSILERLCAGLCEEVLGAGGSRGIGDEGITTHPLLPYSPTPLSSSQQILEYLEHANLFILPLDDQREWYRYHRLFADLLGKQLQQFQPDQISILHQRASRWFERNGYVLQAIEHAFAAGDRAAADLVEQHAVAYLMRGETATLLGWLRALPEEIVRSRRSLDLYRLACMVLTGQPQASIGSELERLELDPDLAHEISVLRAYLAAMQTQYQTARRLARAALAGLPYSDRFFRSLAAWVENLCQASDSGLSERVEILETALRNHETAENRLMWIDGLCTLAEARVRQGDLPAAAGLYRKAIDGAVGPDGRRLPVAGEALIGLGFLMREWNQLEEAVKELEEGIELAGQARKVGIIAGWLGMALCRQAQGDAPAALDAIERARQEARVFDVTDVDDRMVDFFEAVVLHKLGHHGAISRYFENRAARPEPASPGQWAEGAEGQTRFDAHLRKYEQVAQARAFLAADKPEAALSLLDSLLPEMTRQGRTNLVIEIELQRALSLLALRDRAGAQVAFDHALTAAMPGGWVRIFVDEGEAILKLLQASKKHAEGELKGYIDRLMAALNGKLAAQPAFKPSTLQPETLIEPLSQRELEVLHLLAGSLPAREIAGLLSVAESTLNSHLKNIYAKLGVHRRLDAIQKAKELDLL